MNIAQALEIKGEIDSYERQEAAWLLEHLLGINALELKIRLEQELTDMQEQAFLEGLARIEQGEPLAYVTGSQPFWTLDLKVTHDTLVPRPDTEILVETVLKLPLDQQANIVDLGTGNYFTCLTHLGYLKKPSPQRQAQSAGSHWQPTATTYPTSCGRWSKTTTLGRSGKIKSASSPCATTSMYSAASATATSCSMMQRPRPCGSAPLSLIIWACRPINASVPVSKATACTPR